MRRHEVEGVGTLIAAFKRRQTGAKGPLRFFAVETENEGRRGAEID